MPRWRVRRWRRRRARRGGTWRRRSPRRSRPSSRSSRWGVGGAGACLQLTAGPKAAAQTGPATGGLLPPCCRPAAVLLPYGVSNTVYACMPTPASTTTGSRRSCPPRAYPAVCPVLANPSPFQSFISPLFQALLLSTLSFDPTHLPSRPPSPHPSPPGLPGLLPASLVQLGVVPVGGRAVVLVRHTGARVCACVRGMWSFRGNILMSGRKQLHSPGYAVLDGAAAGRAGAGRDGTESTEWWASTSETHGPQRTAPEPCNTMHAHAVRAHAERHAVPPTLRLPRPLQHWTSAPYTCNLFTPSLHERLPPVVLAWFSLGQHLHPPPSVSKSLYKVLAL
mgnify:CR=1 FL=1